MIDASLVIALLAAITLLAGLAARTGTPYPVVLVLGGLVMGLAPGIPSPQLNPDLVLVLFLPPLLYSSAFLSSVGELRANAGPILLLAIGLVLATVGGVAVVGVLVVGLPWAVAFVLGAVLGPTDPVSASAILQRLGAPPRIVTILEGESLVNDATAITAFAIALAAVGSGTFTPLDAIGKFAFEVVVGTVIGLIAAWLAALMRRRLQADAELALTLLTPFIAYIGKQNWKWVLSWGAVCALTTFVFPFNYVDIPHINHVYPAIIARDLIILGMTLVLLYQATRKKFVLL